MSSGIQWLYRIESTEDCQPFCCDVGRGWSDSGTDGLEINCWCGFEEPDKYGLNRHGQEIPGLAIAKSMRDYNKHDNGNNFAGFRSAIDFAKKSFGEELEKGRPDETGTVRHYLGEKLIFLPEGEKLIQDFLDFSAINPAEPMTEVGAIVGRSIDEFAKRFDGRGNVFAVRDFKSRALIGRKQAFVVCAHVQMKMQLSLRISKCEINRWDCKDASKSLCEEMLSGKYPEAFYWTGKQKVIN